MKYSPWLIILLLVVLQLPFDNASAQPLPNTFVLDSVGKARKDWMHHLNTKKLSKLSILQAKGSPGQGTSFKYSKDDFKLLLGKVKAKLPSAKPAVKLYYAAFDSANPGPVPAGKLADKQIVILFAPAKFTGTLPDKLEYAEALGNTYYLLIPGLSKVLDIDIKTSEIWITNYVTNICTGADGLISTIDQGDPDNIYGGDSKPYDTRSVFYPWVFVEELFTTEIQHQLSKFSIPVTGVRMNLCSYTDTGDDYNKFKNRMIIQFDLLMKIPGTNKDIEINLEDQTDFPARRAATVAKYQKEHPNQLVPPMLDFDNGQLCPVNCPPPSSTQP